MAQTGNTVTPETGKGELATRQRYIEYLRHQSKRRKHALSYEEWKRESSKAGGANIDPHLYSLPSIKKDVVESEPELPRC